MPRSRSLAPLLAGSLLLAAFLIYVSVTYIRIARQSWVDETRPVDVIVVFGAAEYSGKPSPIFRARLNHALALFRRGVAPFIVTTGGSGADRAFSEGGVGRDYLAAAGVGEEHLIAETQSSDTADSAERVANIMRRNGMRTCLAVSDGYHIYRIKQMMARQGITAYGAPRPASKPHSFFQRAGLYLREVLSITLWRLHLT